MRSRALNSDKRDAVSEQIADVRMYRDRLASDLAASPIDPRTLRLDMKSLDEAMHQPSTGVTQPQAPNPPRDQQP